MYEGRVMVLLCRMITMGINVEMEDDEERKRVGSRVETYQTLGPYKAISIKHPHRLSESPPHNPNVIPSGERRTTS